MQPDIGSKNAKTIKWGAASAAAVSLVALGFGITWWLNKVDEAQYSSSTSNLYNIGQAASQYEADHNNTFPPADSMPHFRVALAPYVGGASGDFLFVQPENSPPNILNATLSNKPFSSVPNPAVVVLMPGTGVGKSPDGS